MGPAAAAAAAPIGVVFISRIRARFAGDAVIISAKAVPRLAATSSPSPPRLPSGVSEAAGGVAGTTPAPAPAPPSPPPYPRTLAKAAGEESYMSAKLEGAISRRGGDWSEVDGLESTMKSAAPPLGRERGGVGDGLASGSNPSSIGEPRSRKDKKAVLSKTLVSSRTPPGGEGVPVQTFKAEASTQRGGERNAGPVGFL